MSTTTPAGPPAQNPLSQPVSRIEFYIVLAATVGVKFAPVAVAFALGVRP